jgi:hypothetical protein
MGTRVNYANFRNASNQDLRAAFREYEGALKHLAFDDSNARRRYNSDDYGCGWLDGLYSPFEFDKHNAIASKMRRRSFHVAQVAPSPTCSHTSVRGSHVDDVDNIGCIPVRVMGMNVPLYEASSIVHDSGHGPYGHRFESWVKKRFQMDFTHERFGVYVLQHVERDGRGLNLTHQVLTALLYHSLSSPVELHESQESLLLRIVDKIAYLTSDASDGRHGRYGQAIKEEMEPVFKLLSEIGHNQRRWVSFFLLELCRESAEAGRVCFEKSVGANYLKQLRDEMYKIYPRVSPDFCHRQLDLVLEGLNARERGRREVKCAPVLLMALMDDATVTRLAQHTMDYGGYGRNEVIAHIGEDVLQTLESIPDHEFCIRMDKPDLDW